MHGAPGGWPERVMVLVNEDDPRAYEYGQSGFRLGFTEGKWQFYKLQAGSRCADAHRAASSAFPNEPFYGLLCDDQWPITPGWWQAMEKAAEDRYVVCPNGEPGFPLCRTAVCLGGGLVNAMGSIVPAPVKHNFEDNIWDDVAREHGLLRALPNILVEHRHHIRGQNPIDETYRRGSADFNEDQEIYTRWLESDDKRQMNERIKAFLTA